MRFRLLIPIVCFALTRAFALVPEGSALSRALESRLTEFVPTAAPLAATAQDDFPYNLEIYVDGRESAESSSLVSAETTAENKRNLMIFAFTQHEAYTHFETVRAFLTHLAQNPPPCDCIVLFSAQETSPIGDALSFTGTESFAQNCDDADRAAAIAVSFGGEKTVVRTGAEGRMTPLWLTVQIDQACRKKGVSYRYADFFAALYRLGLLRGEQRLSLFIKNAIPSAAIRFASDAELDVLAQFADDFSVAETDAWDSHYIFLRFHQASVVVGEAFFFVICLSLGSLLLLIFCTSTFVGKNGAARKRDFQRSWFFIPLTIALSVFSLWLGQTLCAAISPLANASPIVQFGIKLVVTLLVMAVLFALQEHLKISSIQFTHGYFIYLIAIANIFIFSAADLPLFVTFFAEYICIYIARKSMKIVTLIISVVLMLLPFAPYVRQLIVYGDVVELRTLVFATPVYNLMLALLIFPFLIMWLRMIVRLEIYVASTGISLRRLWLQGALSTLVIIAITMACIATLALLSNRSHQAHLAEPTATIIDENKDTLSLVLTQEQFSGITTRHLTLTAQTDALRYTISVHSNNAVPLYDSSYDYTISESTRTATFTIPDYPPRTITIDYAADTRDAAVMRIHAWFRTDEETVFRKESYEYPLFEED